VFRGGGSLKPIPALRPYSH